MDYKLMAGAGAGEGAGGGGVVIGEAGSGGRAQGPVVGAVMKDKADDAKAVAVAGGLGEGAVWGHDGAGVESVMRLTTGADDERLDTGGT